MLHVLGLATFGQMSTLAQRIISFLEQAKEPLLACDIATSLGCKGSSEVNPTLYYLANAKKVEKVVLVGETAPRWKTVSPEISQRKEKILALLTSSPYPIATRDIPSKLGLVMSRTDINSILYSLLKEGLVIKTCLDDGTNPRWSTK